MLPEDDSRRRQSKVRFPVKGMESLVVTVSGYKETERFQLIKLIDKAGANYVGSMNQSITHLVCRRYEGRKYELARKFKTLIVNHQWVEECIKKGRRVPERPYTFQCGQEVRPLQFNISSIADELRDQPNRRNERKQVVDELRCKVSSHAVLIDTDLLNERQELQSSHSAILSSQKKKKSASAESSRKGSKRRLVKKEARRETLELISDSEEGRHSIFDFHEHHASVAYSNHLNVEWHEDINVSPCEEYQQNRTKAVINVEEDEDVNDVLNFEDKYLYIKGGSSSPVGEVDVSANHTEDVIRSPAPTEFSCVICWTKFSESRGVLPCGHRFCFSCIQTWADHMASSGKTSTCPLCKASFMSITKVDGALSSDQKIYSQTIPGDDSRKDIYILPSYDTRSINHNPSGPPVCCQCSHREPEDLLERCHLCQIRCIHIYCLDPPLFPWTCAQCKDLQMLYLYNR